LILEYLRVVEDLKPLTIMMENVPGLKDYYLFKKLVRRLKVLGYHLSIDIVNIKDYGVPQSRKRLVMLGSLLGEIEIATPTGRRKTVKGTISRLKSPELSNDPIHKIYARHTTQIQEMIAEIPKDGGGRNDLPEKYKLECHKKENIGFNDVYGRLRWNAFATTITGGCLNPSKGRFLHPEENRAITAREAALLQTFPQSYKFSEELTKTAIALQIGNALPPKFSYIQSLVVFNHLEFHREYFT
jgi:DNA (cytosine-5)-methyltransferase 1